MTGISKPDLCGACGKPLWKVPGARMSAFEEGGARHRDHEWGEMQPGGALWSRERLAEAYFLACLDRRGLLLMVDALLAALKGSQP